MDIIQQQIDNLQSTARRLIHLGEEETDCVYADELSGLNKYLGEQINALYPLKGKTIEQEAALCVALQMAYNVYMYVGPKDEVKKQTILNRSCRVLEQLPASLLRCQLLVYCYGEVYNEDFALEAHRIIEDWGNRTFTGEEQEIVSELEAKEEYFKIIF